MTKQLHDAILCCCANIWNRCQEVISRKCRNFKLLWVSVLNKKRIIMLCFNCVLLISMETLQLLTEVVGFPCYLDLWWMTWLVLIFAHNWVIIADSQIMVIKFRKRSHRHCKACCHSGFHILRWVEGSLWLLVSLRVEGPLPCRMVSSQQPSSADTWEERSDKTLASIYSDNLCLLHLLKDPTLLKLPWLCFRG